jgi:hypothetical protein
VIYDRRTSGANDKLTSQFQTAISNAKRCVRRKDVLSEDDHSKRMDIAPKNGEISVATIIVDGFYREKIVEPKPESSFIKKT